MSETQPSTPTQAGWLARAARTQPEVILMGPMMVYLLLMGLQDKVDEQYRWIPMLIKGLGGLAVFLAVRRYLPLTLNAGRAQPAGAGILGRPHLLLGVVCGVIVAAGWIAGQHLFNHLAEWGGVAGKYWYVFRMHDSVDPRVGITAGSWYAQVFARLAVTVMVVPIVEELFWRGFLLRALISWQRWPSIPLGTFTWGSFLGTSLLSVLQHPGNWAVSIACWMAYNALFYWKKSLLFLMVVHGVTNLALYTYAVLARDWLFW